MAYAEIFFEAVDGKDIKSAPVGFSWTTCFFGPLPALFRSDWGNFWLIAVLTIFTGGLSNLYFMFVYNKMHIEHLVAEGYKAKSASIGLARIEVDLGRKLPRLDTCPSLTKSRFPKIAKMRP